MVELYKLREPIEYDSEKVTELSLDLEGLTVGQLERAERRARKMLDKKEVMTVPETNKKYLSCVAAKAAGVELELIRSLMGDDYTQVCVLVQNFLLGGASDTEEDWEDWEDEETPENSKTSNSKKKTTGPALTEFPTDLTN